MQRLENKRILLGVTGGIAAYKATEIIRLLRTAGAGVRVIMTSAAREFITPLTLQALSGHEVHTELLDPKAEAGMGHIELARWADVLLVAPASADFIARMTAGMGDDLLAAVCLAVKAPVCLAPAMNQGMWSDAATQKNCEELAQRGVTLWGPDTGFQACGDMGPGRMLEPADIVRHLANRFETGALSGRRILITAGPTREAIDPVRYLSNHSSGKMGFALAEAAQEAGAQVTLVAGPVQLPTPDRVTRLDVTDACAMHAAVMEAVGDCDIFIGCAAVADYRPETVADKKIKKNPDDAGQTMELKLVRNPDIIAAVAALENAPVVVGFSAETHDMLANAVSKRLKKKMDLIVANNVANPATGFNSDENAVTLIGPDQQQVLPQACKRKLARQLVALIARYCDEHKRFSSDCQKTAQTGC
ncbi:MAG: bifunctional phosphopantothenoylcysteine decarboxylase/phosphopantothenate--cysteine ligase CoaBC [Kistimonas sp.]|nr:bifunctional phosphopantothenoylcysteine decarboxylase/phosphopantothenate--cysteine ligase CoaBC [Kistimonas sp.]